MAIITGPIAEDGALIDVLIRVSRNREERLLANNLRPPEPVHVRAIIDTGSSVTGFHKSVFDRLEIQHFKLTAMLTPSTRREEPFNSPTYDIRLTFVSGTDEYTFGKVHAIETLDFDPDDENLLLGLIGRDILNKCAFSYFGHHKAFELHL